MADQRIILPSNSVPEAPFSSGRGLGLFAFEGQRLERAIPSIKGVRAALAADYNEGWKQGEGSFSLRYRGESDLLAVG